MTDVPPERRRYIRPEDVPKYQQRGLTVYRGRKGGYYIDKLEAEQKGIDDIGEDVREANSGESNRIYSSLEYVLQEWVDLSAMHDNEIEVKLKDLSERIKRENEYVLEDFYKMIDELRLLSEKYSNKKDFLSGIYEIRVQAIEEMIKEKISSNEIADYIVGLNLYIEARKFFDDKLDVEIHEPSVEQFMDLFYRWLDGKVKPKDDVLKKYMYEALDEVLEGNLNAGTIFYKLGQYLSLNEIKDVIKEYVSRDDVNFSDIKKIFNLIDVSYFVEKKTISGKRYNVIETKALDEIPEIVDDFEEVLKTKVSDDIQRMIYSKGGKLTDMLSSNFNSLYSYIRKLERKKSIEDVLKPDFDQLEKYDINDRVDIPEVSLKYDENEGNFVLIENGKIAKKFNNDNIGKILDEYAGFNIGTLISAWKVDSSSNPAALLEKLVAEALNDNPELMRKFREDEILPEPDRMESEEGFSYQAYDPIRFRYSKSIRPEWISKEQIRKMVGLARALIDTDSLVLYRGISNKEFGQILSFLVSDKDYEEVKTYYLTAFSRNPSKALEFNRDIVLIVNASKDAIVFSEEMSPGSAYSEGEVVIRNPKGMKITKKNIGIPNYDEYDSAVVYYDEDKFPLSVSHFWYRIGKINKEMRKIAKEKILKNKDVIERKIELEKQVNKHDSEYWRKLLEEVEGW